jgi:hypothetical protein
LLRKCVNKKKQKPISELSDFLEQCFNVLGKADCDKNKFRVNKKQQEMFPISILRWLRRWLSRFAVKFPGTMLIFGDMPLQMRKIGLPVENA